MVEIGGYRRGASTTTGEKMNLGVSENKTVQSLEFWGTGGGVQRRFGESKKRGIE